MSDFQNFERIALAVDHLAVQTTRIAVALEELLNRSAMSAEPVPVDLCKWCGLGVRECLCSEENLAVDMQSGSVYRTV